MHPGKTILLADDCPTIRAILKVYLAGLRATLLEAADGETALALVRSRPVDLVLADVRMAPVDGIGLLHLIRSDSAERIRRMPVVLLTSDLDEDLRRQALEAGASAFCTKPVGAKELIAAIEKSLPPDSAR